MNCVVFLAAIGALRSSIGSFFREKPVHSVKIVAHRPKLYICFPNYVQNEMNCRQERYKIARHCKYEMHREDKRDNKFSCQRDH